MRRLMAQVPFCHRLMMGLFVLSSACTGVSSLPAGSSSGTAAGTGGNGPGTGAVPGSVGTAGKTSGMGGGVGSGVGIGSVVPTNQLDSGRVTLRRLNRTEYGNTVRALLGTTTDPTSTFPADDVTDGFDTIGIALFYSDLLGEQDEMAAGKLVDELLARPAADPIRTKILVCQPTTANLSTCLTQILTGFMKSAYRRPATPAEISDLVQLATTITQSAGDVNRGVNAALKTVLLSPNFLFHVESTAGGSVAQPLSDYELASRLSYFLWSSMPDTQLTLAADVKMLSAGGANLSAQIDRLLADPKSQGFTTNFAGQWLSIREVSGVSPDPMLFPTVDQALLDAIPQETGLFFQSLLTGAKPLSTLLLADYTFVNARLATHYGLPGGQPTFTQVSLANTNRIGILTQETFLTTTSQPNRSSPVKRGEWILDHLLCDPPPSPPPNVPAFPTIVAGSGLTGRAYLEMHVTNAYCASCHDSIDPIGFTLENFDAIGAYRTKDNGQPIDNSGVMPDGTKFAGAAQIAQWLANDVRYARCVTKQMMTYAVGRPFDAPDALAYVAGVVEPMAKTGTWSNLVHAVATSQAFVTGRGEGP